MEPHGLTHGTIFTSSACSKVLFPVAASPMVHARNCGLYFRKTPSLLCSIRSSSSLPQRPLRYAVLGAGFAGLSVVWHLLQHSFNDLHLRIDIYDEVGIGGGASGVSGGLLHPYSPKVKLLWRGVDCWKECLKLLHVAETEVCHNESNGEVGKSSQQCDKFIVRRRGILRPVMSMKNLNVLNDNRDH